MREHRSKTVGTRDNDSEQVLNELFGPAPRPERKIPHLTLYKPWSRMYHLYRLGQGGLVKFRILGPVNPRDAMRMEQAYLENGA
ncbi:hypothetical protein AEMCBJ_00075 [Cupriavidus necator]|uniref:hypothetical protein n=1 Tax=Cupriavidus necator TaxID=106590 RepID=UPI003F733D64